MNRFVNSALAAAAIFAVSSVAFAAELHVTEVQSRTLKLYKNADGKGGVIARFSKDEVTVPIAIQEKSDRKTYLVEINGQTGWVPARAVRTNEARDVKVHCSQMAGAQALGPTRGLGDGKGCK